MKKTFLQLIDEDTANLRSGKAQLEADPDFVSVPDGHRAARATDPGGKKMKPREPDHEAARELVQVEIPRTALASFQRAAKRRKMNVSEYLTTIAAHAK